MVVHLMEMHEVPEEADQGGAVFLAVGAAPVVAHVVGLAFPLEDPRRRLCPLLLLVVARQVERVEVLHPHGREVGHGEGVARQVVPVPPPHEREAIPYMMR